MKFTATIRCVFSDDKPIKAIASVTVDDAIAIHNVKLIKNADKTFIAMPFESFTDKNGKKIRKDVVHPISSEVRKDLESAVIAAYEQKIADNN